MNASEFFFYVCIAFELIMGASVLYLFIVSLIGWNMRETDENPHEPKKSFAMIVAAHNEETVVANVIESLKLQDYPKEMFDIFVIADNCTDKTAQISTNAGAFVHERCNKVEVGKGFALGWMFDRIFKMDKKYDAVCVFDADNVVEGNYLQKMNDMLCNGHKAIQAYLDCKNPYDSWVTLTNSIMYWVTNRLFNQSRHNLSMWCTIGGTGFCLDMDVLRKIPWDATCLTEDLEYTVKLVLEDIRVSWCGETAIYDEKPVTFKASWNQRKRWMQGHIDVFARYFIKLLKKGIKERKLTPIDLALYNFQPINIVITFITSIILSIIAINFHSYSVIEIIENQMIPTWLMYIILITLNVLPIFSIYILPIIVLVVEKRFNFKVFLGLFLWPIFGLSWIPIIMLGIINRNKKIWNHTVHTRQIKINELENV